MIASVGNGCSEVVGDLSWEVVLILTVCLSLC